MSGKRKDVQSQITAEEKNYNQNIDAMHNNDENNKKDQKQKQRE